MNDLTPKLVVSLVVVPVLIVLFKTWKEASVVAAAIGLALVFANLDKFKSFNAVGLLQAQLNTAIDKAYAAIGQLKDLGVSLSGPIVDNMAISGRPMQYIPLKYKLQRVDEITIALKKLGASQDEVDNVCSTIYGRIKTDHIKKILYSLKNANPKQSQLFNGLEQGKFDSWDETALKKFIKDNNLNEDANVKENFLDLDYFLKNKELRREDQWQS